VLELTIL